MTTDVCPRGCGIPIAHHLHIGTGVDDPCSTAWPPTHQVECAGCHQPITTAFATVGADSFHNADCLRAWLAAHHPAGADGPE